MGISVNGKIQDKDIIDIHVCNDYRDIIIDRGSIVKEFLTREEYRKQVDSDWEKTNELTFSKNPIKKIYSFFKNYFKN